MHGRPSQNLRDTLTMNRLLILAILLASGCANRPPVLPEVPKTVTVVVEKYVAVPDELTAPCPVYEPRESTYNEAKRLALVRRESLEACNKQLERIRALGDKKP